MDSYFGTIETVERYFVFRRRQMALNTNDTINTIQLILLILLYDTGVSSKDEKSLYRQLLIGHLRVLRSKSIYSLKIVAAFTALARQLRVFFLLRTCSTG